MCLMNMFLDYRIIYAGHLHRLYLCYILFQLLNICNNLFCKIINYGYLEVSSCLKVEC